MCKWKIHEKIHFYNSIVLRPFNTRSLSFRTENDNANPTMMPDLHLLNLVVLLPLVSFQVVVEAGLLGAGEGEGSCAAPPFRNTLFSRS